MWLNRIEGSQKGNENIWYLRITDAKGDADDCAFNLKVEEENIHGETR